jgi:hypothetical protein
MSKPHPEGLECLPKSGPYTLTLPAWVVLLVVKLPPALLSGSQSRTGPTTTTRWGHLFFGGGGYGSNIKTENNRSWMQYHKLLDVL